MAHADILLATPYVPSLSIDMSELLLVLRVLLVTTFCAGVLGKARPSTFRTFVDSLISASLIRSSLASSFAVLLIGLEAVSACCLAISSFVVAGLAFSVLTLGILTVGVAVIVGSDREIECSCFGAQGAAISARHLVRNLLLICFAATGLLVAVLEPSALHVAWPDSIAYAFAGLMAGICIVRWDDLAFVAMGAAA